MADTSQEFGKRIKGIRKRLGLTQGELAENTGVSQKSISFYEAGHIPEAPILYRLSKELKVSMEELLIGEKINKVMAQGNVINLDHNRRKEDALFKKHPKLKEQLDLLVRYWLTGNEYIKVLFEAGIKLAEGLAAQENPPPGKKPITGGGKRKKAGGRPIG